MSDRQAIIDVLDAHKRGDWSDMTYRCRGCADREHDRGNARGHELERQGRLSVEARRQLMADYNAATHPGWSMADYNDHVADALVAALGGVDE